MLLLVRRGNTPPAYIGRRAGPALTRGPATPPPAASDRRCDRGGLDARADAPRGPARRADHPRLHRRQRLSRARGRPDLRDLDPGRRHLDGGAALFASSTILENNIVQTVASAAGTLAAIIFVLPGLVMIGWWQRLSLLDDRRGDRGRRHTWA